MAAKNATYENQLLKLIFNGTSIPGLADNTATSPATTFYCALHTADPTSTGNQASNEAAYTGYARVAVARTTSGWVVSGNSVSPAAAVTFPAGTGGSGTATYWSVGTASTGSGSILYSGPLSPTVPMGSGVTPVLSTATSVTES